MRNLKVINNAVYYECKDCWMYYPWMMFTKSKTCQFWLRPICKQCEANKASENREPTVEEALAMINSQQTIQEPEVIIPAPVIVSAPEPAPEPTPTPEPTKPQKTERELDKRTSMRYMKFYKNICRDSEDQFTVWTLWYYDLYMQDNFSKKDYRLARENIDNRFTQHLKDVDTSHLSNVREVFEMIIKWAGKFYDKIQEEATNKWFDFQDYYTKNKESKLVYLTEDWQRNLLN